MLSKDVERIDRCGANNGGLVLLAALVDVRTGSRAMKSDPRRGQGVPRLDRDGFFSVLDRTKGEILR
jgi:hypothetical protein